MQTGNPLWLIRVDAPIVEKTYFKMSKISEKKSGCTFTCSMGREKILISVACAKKTIFCTLKKFTTRHLFIFFT
jgi:hypothetical protein